MSQKAVLVRVNGNLVQEVFSSVPDYDEAVQICIDEGYGEDFITIYDNLLVEYEWIDIGEGESGIDHFIDNETLLFIYDPYDYEKHIYEMFGLNVETVQTGRYEVYIEDLEVDI